MSLPRHGLVPVGPPLPAPRCAVAAVDHEPIARRLPPHANVGLAIAVVVGWHGRVPKRVGDEVHSTPLTCPRPAGAAVDAEPFPGDGTPHGDIAFPVPVVVTQHWDVTLRPPLPSRDGAARTVDDVPIAFAGATCLYGPPYGDIRLSVPVVVSRHGDVALRPPLPSRDGAARAIDDVPIALAGAVRLYGPPYGDIRPSVTVVVPGDGNVALCAPLLSPHSARALDDVPVAPGAPPHGDISPAVAVVVARYRHITFLAPLTRPASLSSAVDDVPVAFPWPPYGDV